MIAHYKEQFPKQGFVLKEDKEDTQKHEKLLTFASSDYQATLSCNRRGLPQQYTILVMHQQFHLDPEAFQ